MIGQSEWIQGDVKLARRAWMRQTPWSWVITGALIVLFILSGVAHQFEWRVYAISSLPIQQRMVLSDTLQLWLPLLIVLVPCALIAIRRWRSMPEDLLAISVRGFHLRLCTQPEYSTDDDNFDFPVATLLFHKGIPGKWHLLANDGTWRWATFEVFDDRIRLLSLADVDADLSRAIKDHPESVTSPKDVQLLSKKVALLQEQ